MVRFHLLPQQKDQKLKWYKLRPVKPRIVGSSPTWSAKDTMLGSPVVTSRVSRPQESSKKQQMGSMRLKCFKSGGGIGMVQDVSVF